MNKEEAMQVFDGVMLSDGGLRKPRRPTHNSYFYLSQSYGELHLDWILYAKEALEAVGFGFSSSTPHIDLEVNSGKVEKQCVLWSKYSLEASWHYRRWYSSGKKTVPRDLSLTPISIANWFMGDATSRQVTANLVTVCFATCSFEVSGVQRLVQQLIGQGVDAYLGWNRDYPVVHVTTVDSVSSLMNLIEPYVLPSFNYKIKKPWRQVDYPRRARCIW